MLTFVTAVAVNNCKISPQLNWINVQMLEDTDFCASTDWFHHIIHVLCTTVVFKLKERSQCLKRESVTFWIWATEMWRDVTDDVTVPFIDSNRPYGYKGRRKANIFDDADERLTDCDEASAQIGSTLGSEKFRNKGNVLKSPASQMSFDPPL